MASITYPEFLEKELVRLNCRKEFAKNRTRNNQSQWHKLHEEKYQYGLIIKSARICLQFGFHWVDTPEGYDYWDKIYEQLPSDEN